MKSWDGWRQLLRYGAIGLGMNTAFYLLYLALTALGASPYVVVGLLYPLAVLTSYLLNRRWSFRFQGDFRSSLARFTMAHVGGYLLNLGLLYMFSGVIGIPHQLVQLSATFLVAGYLFLMLKYFVYV